MQRNRKPKWLFSDLDGTLIPLDSKVANNRDLIALGNLLTQSGIGLAYVTGRHLSSALDAKLEYDLPTPSYIVCDVGTTIAAPETDGLWLPMSPYQQQLASLTAGWNPQKVIDGVASVDALRLQEPEKQSQFKISFYTDQHTMANSVVKIQQWIEHSKAPYSIIDSVSPFTGDGLIDLLPKNVDKGYAARWLANHLAISFEDSVVFAGDSGNDTAALTSGCRAILVGNADQQVAETIQRMMDEKGAAARLFLSSTHATSGVLEGIRHFLA